MASMEEVLWSAQENLWWLQMGFVACLGAIAGSFVNVMVVRLPRGESLVRPRSHCRACHAPLFWWHNIPIVSFLILRGKCKFCGTPFSPRYVVIEMLTALLFLACFMRQGWSWLLVARDFPLMAILMAITFIDLKHRIIPDIFNILGCAIGLGTAYWVPDLGWVDSLLGGGLGFLLFLVLGWGYERMSGKAGLGGGDVKFLAMAGTLVGPFGVLITVLVSSIVGSVVGLLWAWRQGKKNLLGVAIPYGPFLVLGLLAYHLLGKSFWMNIYGSSSIP